MAQVEVASILTWCNSLCPAGGIQRCSSRHCTPSSSLCLSPVSLDEWCVFIPPFFAFCITSGLPAKQLWSIKWWGSPCACWESLNLHLGLGKAHSDLLHATLGLEKVVWLTASWSLSIIRSWRPVSQVSPFLIHWPGAPENQQSCQRSLSLKKTKQRSPCVLLTFNNMLCFWAFNVQLLSCVAPIPVVLIIPGGFSLVSLWPNKPLALNTRSGHPPFLCQRTEILFCLTIFRWITCREEAFS